ncbi:MAG: hypothetical protein ACK4Z6_04845 [Candidatus Methylomirabilales bacterium]
MKRRRAKMPYLSKVARGSWGGLSRNASAQGKRTAPRFFSRSSFASSRWSTLLLKGFPEVLLSVLGYAPISTGLDRSQLLGENGFTTVMLSGTSPPPIPFPLKGEGWKGM